jgi:putative tryptophan/tyrosine transport system substrate-binding protein
LTRPSAHHRQRVDGRVKPGHDGEGDSLQRSSHRAIIYGTSVADTWPLMSAQADKILKGAVLGDLPVEVVTRRELVFNLKTAREVGIVIPPGPLKRAERIIE